MANITTHGKPSLGIKYQNLSKFTIYNFNGVPCAYYLVDRQNIKILSHQETKLNCSSLVIEELLSPVYDYHVFISHSAQIIKGSNQTLKIVGLSEQDQGIFYKYQLISLADYYKLDVPEIQTDLSVLALAYTNLANGNLNLAKYICFSSLDYTLINKHKLAMTPDQIKQLSQDLQQAIFNPNLLKTHQILPEVPINNKISLLELINLLEEHRDSIIINLQYLEQNYQRTRVKRIEGFRDAEGTVVEPRLKTKLLDGSQYIKIHGFKINHNTATINMLIKRPVQLETTEDQTQIIEVAGILLTNQHSFKNYTIVSDGIINLKNLKIKISDRLLFERLKKEGVLALDDQAVTDFDFRVEYDLGLDQLPLIPDTISYGNMEGVFENLATIKILSSILSAHLTEESPRYTTEQLAELKGHYQSKHLYINFPTTTIYNDLQEAISQGLVQTRTSYKIEIGSHDILNLRKLHSANKFLSRYYEVYLKETKEKLAKPNFAQTINQEVVYRPKPLSARTKITPVDELMKPIFDNFLGLTDNGSVAAILSKVGAENLIWILEAKWKQESINHDELILLMTDAKQKLDNYFEEIYRTQISGLIFYIGSTGLLPDGFMAKAKTAQEISDKYPHLQLSKHEQQGTFFELGNNIISIYAKTEYFSLDLKS